MSPSPLELLRHILDEIDFLLMESSGNDEQSFLADEKCKRAFVRSFEIIGEASKNIPADFKEQHRGVQWKSMARMRDRLIHHYFGVDYPIVWDTVVNDIPNLKIEILQILKVIDGDL